MPNLTERDIIRAALPFIKAHYKFRPRGPGEMISRYEMTTQAGVIADGYLQFTAESGHPFIVTVEATSQESRKEVTYRIQEKILWWDSLAISSILVTLAFGYSHYYGYDLVQNYGPIPVVCFILGLLLILIFIFRMTIGRMRRYRYIYAIEQFKRYHADEQWIALGTNVFSASRDKRLLELKEQCVDNGFGLVLVDEQLDAQLVITPSREEVFGKKRKNLVFTNRDQVLTNSRRAKVKNWFRNSRLNRVRSVGGLSRYRARHFKQLGILTLSMMVLGGIYYKEFMDKPIIYVNEKKYESERLKAKINQHPEKEGYLLEVDTILDVDQLNGNYLSMEETVEGDDYLPRTYSNQSELDLLELEATPERITNRREVLVASAGGVYAGYDCERINITGTALYLVQDGVYKTPESAKTRMEKLQRNGLPNNLLWLGCFSTDAGYVVYYDLLHTDKVKAKTAGQKFVKSLKEKGLEEGRVMIRTLKKL